MKALYHFSKGYSPVWRVITAACINIPRSFSFCSQCSHRVHSCQKLEFGMCKVIFFPSFVFSDFLGHWFPRLALHENHLGSIIKGSFPAFDSCPWSQSLCGQGLEIWILKKSLRVGLAWQSRWLRAWTSTARSTSSISSRGPKISHATWHDQN